MDAIARLISILPQFFPPFWSLSYFEALLKEPLLQTLEMGAGGIFVALAAGMVSGIWIGAGLPGGRLIYRLFTALRSIPDLTLAIFCVVVIGIGPAAGTLALAIFYSAAVGKIFSDLFRSADRGPVEALQAAGATRLATAFFGLLPLRMKDIVSYGAYEFESAIRASVIVGAVGGGGLGTEIMGTINALDYRRTTSLIIVMILLIAGIDKLAQQVKRRPALAWIIVPLGAAALWVNRPTMVAIPHAVETFRRMFPPDLSLDQIHELPKLFLETFEIAFGGTLIGMIAALPLGLLAARNFTPVYVSVPLRRFLEALRAIPEIVWGLVLVSAIGVGPSVGLAALALHTSGALGRLYAESFENIAVDPVRALTATGARPVSVAAFGFVPLALAAISVHTLFRLEWNVRAATVVGVIGAGGIGTALFNSQQLFHYQEMIAYILLTGLLVTAVDFSSGRLRRRMKLMEIYA